MAKLKPETSPPVLRLICYTFGHDYIVSRKINDEISEYKCVCCGNEVTNGYAGRLETLTYERKEVNKCLSSFFLEKRRQAMH